MRLSHFEGTGLKSHTVTNKASENVNNFYFTYSKISLVMMGKCDMLSDSKGKKIKVIWEN